MFQMMHSAVSTDMQQVEKQWIKKWLKSERKKHLKLKLPLTFTE